MSVDIDTDELPGALRGRTTSSVYTHRLMCAAADEIDRLRAALSASPAGEREAITERQAVLDVVNLYGDETLHSALDAIGWPDNWSGAAGERDTTEADEVNEIRRLAAIVADLRRKAASNPPMAQANGYPGCDACNVEDRERAMVTLERDADGTPTVWCDPCIAQLIAALNAAGLRTDASCCGHGGLAPTIALADGRWLLVTDHAVAYPVAAGERDTTEADEVDEIRRLAVIVADSDLIEHWAECPAPPDADCSQCKRWFSARSALLALAARPAPVTGKDLTKKHNNKEKTMEFLIKFETVEDTEKIDLTYLGIVSGGNDEGTVAILEPDMGLESLSEDVQLGVMQQAVNAAKAGRVEVSIYDANQEANDD